VPHTGLSSTSRPTEAQSTSSPCPRCGVQHPGANGDRIAFCGGLLRPAPRLVFDGFAEAVDGTRDSPTTLDALAVASAGQRRRYPGTEP
jgi:hypothetical protein